MEQSLAPGSQTFEQALFYLYKDNKINLEEAMANADSPTNLHWLINNAAKVSTNGAGDGQSSDSRITQPAEDLSSIKLNLDALG